jgi:hypothetical protein
MAEIIKHPRETARTVGYCYPRNPMSVLRRKKKLRQTLSRQTQAMVLSDKIDKFSSNGVSRSCLLNIMKKSPRRISRKAGYLKLLPLPGRDSNAMNRGTRNIPTR